VTARATWRVLHGLLTVLALFSLDALLLKFTRPTAAWLPAALAAMFAIALVLRRLARAEPDLTPGGLRRLWSRLDGPALVWLGGGLALLVVFHAAFERASGDGREYFAQLHSVVIDRDLNFQNEAREFGADEAAIYPFGSAWLWLPFYLVAHLWLGALNLLGANLRHEGYYYPYQMAVGLGTLAYGVAGLFLVYRIGCDYFSRWVALAATYAIAAGSFVVWYLAVDSSYTHGNSLFAVSLFLYLWHRTRAGRSVRGWALLGAAGGLMTMVRWQNAAFLLPLALDALAVVWRAVRGRERHRRADELRGIAAAAAAGFVAFLPQLYFWKVVNGGWLSVPHAQAGQQWWRDSLLLDVLFSPNHGLLSSHPLLYLALAGVPLFLRRDWRLGVLLVTLFAGQVFINGAVTTWWGGTAFGGRRFDGTILLFVLGLASLMEWTRRRPVVLWAAPIGVAVVMNALFMRDVRLGRVAMDEAVGIERVVRATVDRIGNPFSFPANAIFSAETGLDPASYDRLGVRRYNNVRIDVGGAGDTEFLARGWADPERNDQMSFRWAIGRESTMGVALMGPRYIAPGEPYTLSDYVMHLRVAPFEHAGAPPQTLAVDVNGERAGAIVLRGGVHDYALDVPGRALRRSLNGIRFRYGYAVAPRDLKMSGDARPLAVLFDSIRLEQKRPDE
jgi:hypothetical protein